MVGCSPCGRPERFSCSGRDRTGVWLFAQDEYGRRRIDVPDDWVRQEIQLGLELDKTIMPLLVRHSEMAPDHALPPEISSLSSRQAFSIRGESWGHDVEFVLRELEPHLGPRVAASPASVPEEETPRFTADDFRAVTLGFDSRDQTVRQAAAKKIEEIARFLELDEVLELCRSRYTAELVGAAIALGVHIRSSPDPRADRRVLSALGE